ncbi:DUF3093 domain-containing protein [Leucobacter sp. CSA2]|uniref:DUF3093 domain-containing protein n=1 Tax=Leucobacter edaphi TaxID=2796472 RepID=A0A934QB15_9MICO|nr:DUF3093 domain-containing protein [Leucobacter edaphi]MBK0421271.1 DUF3093 domain-containing protein [Leucobacter edaphi]
MTSDAPAKTTALPYSERLLPGPGLFTALLLLVPGVTLVLTPINSSIALPTAIVVYLLIALALILMSPSIRVENGTLMAGRARIPVSELGDVELLGAEAMRAAIGTELDARSYTLVRGWIHRGVRIANTDPEDPAPFWIITTRHPKRLADAIAAARG